MKKKNIAKGNRLSKIAYCVCFFLSSFTSAWDHFNSDRSLHIHFYGQMGYSFFAGEIPLAKAKCTECN